MRKSNITIWTRLACEYRQAFYLGLADRLARHAVGLTVVAGKPWPEEAHCDILPDIPFGVRCNNRRIWHSAYIARLPEPARGADLLIIEQNNSAIHNYYYLLRRLAGCKKPRLAFWGHGTNRQSAPHSAGNRWKKLWLNKVDWWFTYTQSCGDYITQNGFPSERITVVNNSVDCDAMHIAVSAIREKQPPVKQNGLYCGRIVPEKNIAFLLAAADRIHAALPGFTLTIIGGGSAQHEVEKFAAERSWVHFTGPLYGQARAPYFAAADVMLNPGFVGLSIIDAFSAGLPVVTTRNAPHSPEIDYMEEGRSGLLTDDSPEQFAADVIALLNDPQKLADMRNTAYQTYKRYSLPAMVDRFTDGILAALEGSD